jgi:hypothetical protein
VLPAYTRRSPSMACVEDTRSPSEPTAKVLLQVPEEPAAL